MFCLSKLRFASSHCRTISSLVIAETSGASISGGTLSAITAASQLGGPVSVLVSGSQYAKAASAATQVAGVSKVLHASDVSLDHMLAENTTEMLRTLQSTHAFTHILTSASNVTKNILPRLGAVLDLAPVADVLEILDSETFIRPTYAGNALATVKSHDSIKLLTIRATAFEKAEMGTTTFSEVEEVQQAASREASPATVTWVSEQVSASDRPDLTAATVVVAGGRGLKNGENFQLLETLADRVGGAVGASRAAVDAGYCPNDYQVGQTGKVVAPDLYIAVGISGAIQHLAGMKDSKTIVSINKDEEAPIFQVSDYGLVEDLFKVLPELTDKIA